MLHPLCGKRTPREGAGRLPALLLHQGQPPKLSLPVHRKEEQVVNDAQVSIRTATPRDGEGLRTMFARSSAKTIYLRFHMPYPEVPEWMMSFKLDGDHQEKEALVSVAQGRIVGHAMY